MEAEDARGGLEVHDFRMMPGNGTRYPEFDLPSPMRAAKTAISI
jgi:hypothetical protein